MPLNNNHRVSSKLTKRSRIELFVFSSNIPVSKAEICAALPDISPTTVEAVLGILVKNGDITKVGAGRASKYIKS